MGYISGVMPPKARLATLYILVIFYYRPWQHVQVRGKGDFSVHRAFLPRIVRRMEPPRNIARARARAVILHFAVAVDLRLLKSMIIR